MRLQAIIPIRKQGERRTLFIRQQRPGRRIEKHGADALRRPRIGIVLQRHRFRHGMGRLGGENRFDPLGAADFGPFVANGRGIRAAFGRQVHLVCRSQEAGGGIDATRQLPGGQKSRPFVAAVARYRQQPVPIASDRRETGGEPADIALDIGTDIIDRGRSPGGQGRAEG